MLARMIVLILLMLTKLSRWYNGTCRIRILPRTVFEIAVIMDDKTCRQESKYTSNLLYLIQQQLKKKNKENSYNGRHHSCPAPLTPPPRYSTLLSYFLFLSIIPCPPSPLGAGPFAPDTHYIPLSPRELSWLYSSVPGSNICSYWLACLCPRCVIVARKYITARPPLCIWRQRV